MDGLVAKDLCMLKISIYDAAEDIEFGFKLFSEKERKLKAEMLSSHKNFCESFKCWTGTVT